MLILSILMVTVIIVTHSITSSGVAVGTKTNRAAELAGEQARTSLSQENPTMSTGRVVTVEVTNIGSTSVTDYERMDVIVEYRSNDDGAMLYKRLRYATSTVAADNRWTDRLRTPDIYRPSAWDDGETLTIGAVIGPRQESGTTGRVTISTPNGVSVTEEFSRPHWKALSGAPDDAHDGGGLATDGTHIYALRGDGTSDFWRYDVDDRIELVGNVWTSLTSTPASVEEGGALVYATDAGSPYIFALRGDNTTDFWRYDIAADSWTTRNSTPAAVRYGGVLVWDGASTIYAFRGGSGTSSAVCCDDFWSYSISADSWSTSPADAPENVHEGASLAYVNGDIYATRGDNTIEFWRYSVSGDSWTSIAPLPGAAMAFDASTSASETNADDFISFSATVGNFANRVLIVGAFGEETGVTNCTAVSVTYNGVAMAEIDEVLADGSSSRRVCVGLWYLLAPNVGTHSVVITWAGNILERAGGAISLYNAAQQAPEAFNSQVINDSPPTTITTGVTTLSDGAWVVDGVGSGNEAGNMSTLEPGQTERYDDGGSNQHRGAGSTKRAAIAGPTYMGWDHPTANRLAHVVAAFAPISSAPSGMDEGGDLVWTGGDYIFAWRGDETTEFWRYSISTDTWTVMEDTPSPVGEGGDLVFLNGEIYGLRGDLRDDLWSYQPRGY